jgi:hypothetical protein
MVIVKIRAIPGALVLLLSEQVNAALYGMDGDGNVFSLDLATRSSS